MKVSLSDRQPFEGHDGHVIHELLGIPTANIAKYSVAHVAVPAGFRGGTRRNQFDEILIGIDGEGILRREYGSDEIGPTDVLLIPAGTSYAVDVPGDDPLTMWAICVPAFRPEWSEEGRTRGNWRDYETPRGIDRLRPGNDSEY